MLCLRMRTGKKEDKKYDMAEYSDSDDEIDPFIPEDASNLLSLKVILTELLTNYTQLTHI